MFESQHCCEVCERTEKRPGWKMRDSGEDERVSLFILGKLGQVVRKAKSTKRKPPNPDLFVVYCESKTTSVYCILSEFMSLS